MVGYFISLLRPLGVMDSITVFDTVDIGSSPMEGTKHLTPLVKWTSHLSAIQKLQVRFL